MWKCWESRRLLFSFVQMGKYLLSAGCAADHFPAHQSLDLGIVEDFTHCGEALGQEVQQDREATVKV